MPIYEYRCQSCGAQKEVLQRMNDAPLTDCEECGQKNTLSKMVTAAGFQLKGTGWYVTDFKNSGSQPKTDKPKKSPAADSNKEAAAKTESGTDSAAKSEQPAEAKKESSTDSKKDAPKPGNAGASPA